MSGKQNHGPRSVAREILPGCESEILRLAATFHSSRILVQHHSQISRSDGQQITDFLVLNLLDVAQGVDSRQTLIQPLQTALKMVPKPLLFDGIALVN